MMRRPTVGRTGGIRMDELESKLEGRVGGIADRLKTMGARVDKIETRQTQIIFGMFCMVCAGAMALAAVYG